MRIKELLQPLGNKFYLWLDKKTKRKDGKQDYCSCVPDVWFGVDISLACKSHDEHYDSQDVSKEEADYQFLEDLKTIAKENKNWKLYLIAYIYFFGVRTFGSVYEW